MNNFVPFAFTYFKENSFEPKVINFDQSLLKNPGSKAFCFQFCHFFVFLPCVFFLGPFNTALQTIKAQIQSIADIVGQFLCRMSLARKFANEMYRSFWPITLLFQFRFQVSRDSNSGFRVIHPSGRVNPFQLSNHCFSLLSGSLQTAFFIDLTSCFCLRRG